MHAALAVPRQCWKNRTFKATPTAIYPESHATSVTADRLGPTPHDVHSYDYCKTKEVIAVAATKDDQRATPLALSYRVMPTGEVIADIGGELDIATTEMAVSYVTDVIDHHRGPVIVNLTGLRFCDARGLSALLRMANHAEHTGHPFVLASPNPPLVKLIRITGLDRRFCQLASYPPDPACAEHILHGTSCGEPARTQPAPPATRLIQKTRWTHPPGQATHFGRAAESVVLQGITGQGLVHRRPPACDPADSLHGFVLPAALRKEAERPGPDHVADHARPRVAGHAQDPDLVIVQEQPLHGPVPGRQPFEQQITGRHMDGARWRWHHRLRWRRRPEPARSVIGRKRRRRSGHPGVRLEPDTGQLRLRRLRHNRRRDTP